MQWGPGVPLNIVNKLKVGSGGGYRVRESNLGLWAEQGGLDWKKIINISKMMGVTGLIF